MDAPFGRIDETKNVRTTSAGTKRISDLHQQAMRRHLKDVSIRVIRRPAESHAVTPDALSEFVRGLLGKAGTRRVLKKIASVHHTEATQIAILLLA